MTSQSFQHHAYVVELDDTTVGIVVRDEDDAFRFYASSNAFNALEARRFATPREAQAAARALRKRGRWQDAA